MAVKRYVGIGKEISGYGLAAAAQRYAESIASVKPDQGWIIPAPVASREFRSKHLGPYRSRGTVGDFPVRAEDIIGELLLGTFGSVTTTNPATGVYEHVFSPGDSLQSYTFRIGSEQTERVLPGGLVEALTFRFPHDDDVKARAEVLSGFVESKTTLGAPNFSDLTPFNIFTGTPQLTIAGSVKTDLVYDLEITLKNNIPFARGDLSGRTFAKKRYGQREITGRLSAYFDDTTEYDRFIAGSEFTLIALVDGATISGIHKYTLKLELRKCVYLKDLAPDIVAINEPLVVDAPFKAFYDTSGGFNAEAKATLKNTIASY